MINSSMELRIDDGPRALRAVLPIARMIRKVGLTVRRDTAHSPPPAAATPTHMDRMAVPSATHSVPVQPSDIGRRTLKRLYEIVLRPWARPLAWRVRGFLTAGIREDLAAMREELAARSASASGSSETRIVRAVEDAILTLAVQTRSLQPDCTTGRSAGADQCHNGCK